MTRRTRSGALLAAGAVLFLTAPAAHAYKIGGRSWPSGRVPVYNEAKASAGEVKQAIAAWNGSGARVRFVVVSRSRAKLVIRYSRRTPCGEGFATLGYMKRSSVYIGRPAPGCSPQARLHVLIHELGHVLGLNHEDRRCARMNSFAHTGGRRASAGGGYCPLPPHDWQWRCRPLELDDIRGAVRRYGGTAKVEAEPYCDVYSAGPGPTILNALSDAGTVRVELLRPSTPLFPAWFNVASPATERRAVVGQLGSCPDVPPAYPLALSIQPWQAAVGATEYYEDSPSEPGLYCYRVWSWDSAGRPTSSSPHVWVEVPA